VIRAGSRGYGDDLRIGSYVIIVAYRIIVEIKTYIYQNIQRPIQGLKLIDGNGKNLHQKFKINRTCLPQIGRLRFSPHPSCFAFILAEATALFTRKERRSIPAITMEV
jgi:hypothetical protein